METIDYAKTAERCKLVNQSELARTVGVTKPLVHHVIHGTYQYMASGGAQAVLAKLRELNLLVYVGDPPDEVDRAA